MSVCTVLNPHPVTPAEQRPRIRRTGRGNGLTMPRGRHRDNSERRANVDQLCIRMTALCESAVDPLEIAAGLEAEGLGDQEIHAWYGFPDVFGLAEEMYRRVPRRPAEPEPQAELWRAKPAEHVMHSLLYVLPGVCFPAAASLLGATTARTALVIAIVFTWTVSQGLSYLGYARLGRGDPGGAARVLQRGMAVGIFGLLGILYAFALLARASLSDLAFAAGQGTYILAATVLMVRGAHQLLLAALAPGLLASTAFLLMDSPPWLALPLWSALAGTVLLALVLAVVRTTREAPPAATPSAIPELRTAVPHALFGFLAAGLLTFPIVAAELTATPIRPAITLAVLALALSMGAAEWVLYWYRNRIWRLMHTTGNLRRFAVGTRLVLLGAVLRYLIAAALLMATTIGVATASGLHHPQWSISVDVIANLALGGALFIALLLQALNGGALTLLACATAVGVEVALVTQSDLDMMTAQAMTCVGLIAVLFLHAGIVLGRPMRHQ